METQKTQKTIQSVMEFENGKIRIKTFTKGLTGGLYSRAPKSFALEYNKQNLKDDDINILFENLNIFLNEKIDRRIFITHINMNDNHLTLNGFKSILENLLERDLQNPLQEYGNEFFLTIELRNNHIDLDTMNKFIEDHSVLLEDIAAKYSGRLILEFGNGQSIVIDERIVGELTYFSDDEDPNQNRGPH